MKSLNGAEIADYMKENQARWVRRLRANGTEPKLVIIRDSENPVIEKYVELKKQYGEDIGIVVEDWLRDDVRTAIRQANSDDTVHGIIVQLPMQEMGDADSVLGGISPAKDVDGLALYHGTNNEKNGYSSGDINFSEDRFVSATATAINWLVTGYDLDLRGAKIAVVGYGRLIGRPLSDMWKKSGYDVTVFRRGDDLNELKNYDLVVSGTGAPGLIKSEMIGTGSAVVDAGTASEGGILVGDVADEVRQRSDLRAITPKVGGVGPLTVAAMFEHVLMAAERAQSKE